MRKTLLLVFILSSFYSLQAQIAGFKTYSLNQAVEYGIQNNIGAKNAKLSETEAVARNHELLSIGLPQISGEFNYQYYMIKPISPAFAQDLALFGLPANTKIYFNLNHNVNTGVSLNQLVYDTRYFIGIQTFKSLIKLSKQSTALTEQDIRYAIMKSYYEVQAAKEILRLLDSNLVVIEKLVYDTKQTFKEGLVEETDVDRLLLGESTLKSQINNTKNLYDLALSALKFNMGLQLTDRIALTDNLENLRKQIPDAVPFSFDPSQRIESQLIETSIMLKTFDKKQRQAGYYPALYAFANFGGGSQVNNFGDFFRKQQLAGGATASNWFDQAYVGFTLKIPIYDGGQKEASVKQAKIELEKAKNDLANFKNQSSLQVEAAKTNFATNLGEEQNAKESMRLNNKIFNKTTIKYKEGVSSSFELIQTQQDQTINQIKYFNAVKNVLNSRADLDKALGKQ